jgi:hypothetical protein
MPPLRRLVLGLNAATVVLVVAGILLLVAPWPVPEGRAIASVMASGSPVGDSVRQAAVADLGAADRVVRTDIFSPRRTAPSQRYVLGDGGSQADAAPAETTVAPALAGEPMDSATASTAADVVPHLYGTMLGPVDATALLRLDGRVSEPRLFRVGDRAGGYRVVEIADRSVTLMGPGGRVVLRLVRPDQ